MALTSQLASLAWDDPGFDLLDLPDCKVPPSTSDHRAWQLSERDDITAEQKRNFSVFIAGSKIVVIVIIATFHIFQWYVINIILGGQLLALPPQITLMLPILIRAGWYTYQDPNGLIYITMLLSEHGVQRSLSKNNFTRADLYHTVFRTLVYTSWQFLSEQVDMSINLAIQTGWFTHQCSFRTGG